MGPWPSKLEWRRIINKGPLMGRSENPRHAAAIRFSHLYIRINEQRDTSAPEPALFSSMASVPARDDIFRAQACMRLVQQLHHWRDVHQRSIVPSSRMDLEVDPGHASDSRSGDRCGLADAPHWKFPRAVSENRPRCGILSGTRRLAKCPSKSSDGP